MSEKIGETKALCPECLKTIPADKIAEDDKVFIVKTCPEHGTYKVQIWNGVEDYLDMYRYEGVGVKPTNIAVTDKKDCPSSCGLCKEHIQHTCLGVIEVTNMCNLNCPVCFAKANNTYKYHPTMEEIRGMFQTVIDFVDEPRCVQLSGGEPTIRDDLPDIVRMGRSMGINHIEVNSNGVRFANDVEFIRQLKDAGVASIYFSFDGVTGDVYEKTCGRDLLDVKMKALKNLIAEDMAVTLVSVVAPDVNIHQIGDIINFAKANVPNVKGVHFQPLSFVGRYPAQPADEDRVFLPDLVAEIERQTNGQLTKDNFIPTSCANCHCDIKSLSVVLEDGSLFPMTFRALGPRKSTEDIADKTRCEMADLWRYVEESLSGEDLPEDDGSWGSLIARAKTNYLTVSAMPFQDVWVGEVERWERCCIHVVTPDNRLIPLCLFNVNNTAGETMYRHQILSRFACK